MKKKFRIYTIGFLILTILFGVYYFYVRPQQMVKVTLEWGRLAPFPDEIDDFKIQTEGSMFTRSFRATFKCNPKTIHEWVKSSPGLQDAQVEIKGAIKHYEIKPGGGANSATVDIDTKTDAVKVYVCWS